MEISANTYFLFWAAISAIFLKLAFHAIDNTELSNTVSPLVMMLFKHSSAIFTCYSSNHALYRSQLNKPALGSYLLFFINGIMVLVILTGGSLAHCYLPIYAVTSQYHLFLVASNDGRFSSKWKLVLYAWYVIATAFVIVPSFGPTNFKGHSKTLTMVAVTSQNIISIIIFKDGGNFRSKWELLSYSWYVIAAAFASVPLPANILIMFSSSLSLPSFLFGGPAAAAGESESRPTTDPVHDPNLILTILDFNHENYKKKIKKLVEFVLGLLGTILFQNFFRMNSFEEVVGFLYFAVAWLANTTMLSVSHDLGVFDFLLGNAIVGCSVSEFGLRRQTWIAYAACVFLYSLRLKLQSLSFVNTQHGNRKVILW